MKYIVIADRNTDYFHPLTLRRGSCVHLGESCAIPHWENWIMCTTENNRGWVPLQIIERLEGNRGIIKEDYTANELCVVRGEVIIGEKELNGWLFGYKQDNGHTEGWVPLENVKPL